MLRSLIRTAATVDRLDLAFEMIAGVQLKYHGGDAAGSAC